MPPTTTAPRKNGTAAPRPAPRQAARQAARPAPRPSARPASRGSRELTLCNRFGVTEPSLATRREFLRLSEEDEQLLISMIPWAEEHCAELAARFYDWQFTFGPTRTFFDRIAQKKGVALATLRGHLEKSQANYLLTCFTGAESSWDRDYFEYRLSVGVVHDRIDLPFKWYIGSYSEWNALVSEKLMETETPEHAARVLMAVNKVWNLDMQAIGDAFLLSTFESMGLSVEDVKAGPGEDRTEQVAQVKGAVTALLGAAQAIASNNLRRDQKLDAISGKLGRAFNEMTDNLATFVSSVGQNAQVLASAAEELNAVSQQMSASAEETSVQADVVSKAAQQVSGSVTTVATSSEEMSASIKEIARSAAEAARVALSAVAAAESTNQTVHKLGASGAEIGKVVKVITGIAAQTKLLAINATIEAARAGDAGKGFAVVANEVKELAKETAAATDEIGQRIEAIQTDTRQAVEAIAEIGAIIKQINEHQSTIASAVEEQSATTNEIDRNVSEAATGTTEIARNVSGVAEAARHTSQGTGDTQKAAAELTRMASELQRMITRFTV